MAERIVLLLLGLTATVLMCANAIGRYVFSSSIVWAEELVRICFVWGMFIAITHGFVTNEHIGFTAVSEKNRMSRTVSAIVSNIVLGTTGLILCVLGAQYSLMTGAIRLAGSNLPTAVLQVPGIIAGAFWVLLALFRLVLILAGKKRFPDEEQSTAATKMVVD